jgi:hypothetical protein
MAACAAAAAASAQSNPVAMFTDLFMVFPFDPEIPLVRPR